ncbi:helix-turn-helix transcriptional regulator [Oryzihumus leptocrescens]|uniref:Regulatory LuxR family protein n=1 Tax=Oryzihumus leptocrescens TaxID=297536 RepID=A0A542ZH08_9MICO|nr:helix-turn-helix transcriptional regulator [Oryzihumus leptocrescens]TQL59633.1 regulatory LuxR family protein [Oryzihumus leptocrescens]
MDGLKVPHEWAAIVEATARLRQSASRAIGASVHGSMQAIPPDEISLEELQLLGRNGDEARERLPFVERHASHSVWALSPDPADPRALQAAATERSRARGLDMRMVLDLAAVQGGPVAGSREHLDRVLVAPVFLHVILVDQRAVILEGPRLDTHGTSCWLLPEPEVVQAALALWESTLSHAAPLPEHVVQLTERQRAIANLLLHGHTDAAIARQIGVSVRTVASEVRQLMHATGSSTRYQTAMRLFGR